MAESSTLKELGDVLHSRMVAGDKLVSAEVSEIFFPVLCKAVERRFHNLPDPHLVTVAAEDAFLAYLQQPGKFDPQKSSLIAYLYLAARRNVIDKLRASTKIFVELDSTKTEHTLDEDANNPELKLIEEEAAQFAPTSPAMRRMFAVVTDPVDRKLIRLMMDGARDTKDYAEVMEIQDLSFDEQKAKVKLHKDRIKTALRRNLKDWEPK
jgi:DNA-directed RNA polymerase specialized sigma24 family protein